MWTGKRLGIISLSIERRGRRVLLFRLPFTIYPRKRQQASSLFVPYKPVQHYGMRIFWRNISPPFLRSSILLFFPCVVSYRVHYYDTSTKVLCTRTEYRVPSTKYIWLSVLSRCCVYVCLYIYYCRGIALFWSIAAPRGYSLIVNRWWEECPPALSFVCSWIYFVRCYSSLVCLLCVCLIISIVFFFCSCFEEPITAVPVQGVA